MASKQSKLCVRCWHKKKKKQEFKDYASIGIKHWTGTDTIKYETHRAVHEVQVNKSPPGESTPFGKLQATRTSNCYMQETQINIKLRLT